jgi:WD40 repeat protein
MVFHICFGQKENIDSLFFEAVKDNNIDQVKRYINNGADINAIDASGNTLLHFSSANKLGLKITRLLIKMGIEVNIPNHIAYTPLYIAELKNNIKTVNLLKKNGAANKGVSPLLTLPIGHTDRITSVKFSPDGNCFISASADKTIKLWDLKTGKEIKTFKGHGGEVTSIDCSPDGNYFISGSTDSTIILWDIITGENIKTFIGHKAGVSSVCCSPDGEYFLSCSNDGIIKLWNLPKRVLLKNFKGSAKYIVFSPNGKYFLSLSGQKIDLWNIKKSRIIKEYKEKLGGSIFTSIAYAPDGNHFIAATRNPKLLLWEIKTGEILKSFKESNRFQITSVSYSHDGKHFISSNIDTHDGNRNSIKLWSISTGKQVREFNGYHALFEVAAYSPDGNYVISGSEDKIMQLWDVAKGEEIKKIEKITNPASCVALSPIENSFLSGSNQFHYVNLWDIANAQMIKSLDQYSSEIADPSGYINSISFSPVGKYFATAHSISTYVGTSLLWDIKTGINIKRFDGHFNDVNALAFSSDGKCLLTGSSLPSYFLEDTTLKEKTLILWDVKSGNELKSIFNTASINSVAFNPDNKNFIVGYSSAIELWDLNQFKIIKTFNGHLSPERISTYFKKRMFDGSNPSSPYKGISVSYSPDGKSFISGSMDKTIKLWNIESGVEIKTFFGHTNWVNSVAYSQVGNTFLSGSKDATIKLWDISSGKILQDLKGHRASISMVNYLPRNSNLALSCADDYMVKLWDLKNGKELVSFISVKDHDWLTVTPDNYYYGSKDAVQSVSYTMGMRVFNFEQFDIQYNRPDIILERIGLVDSSTIELYRKAYHKRLKKSGFNEKMFNSDWHVPSLLIRNRNDLPFKTINNKLILDIKAMDTKYALNRVNIWVNDVPVFGKNGASISKLKTSKFINKFELILSKGKNKIQVSTHNEKTVESYKETVYIDYIPVKELKPDLYFISIGVSEYENPLNNLSYADKDAKDLMKLFEKNNDAFNQIHLIPILNLDATKQNILAIKDSLMKTKVDDQVIIFYAGHGVFGNDDNYYLAGADVENDNIEGTALSYDDFESLLDKIPARKKILFIDACHSGEADVEENYVPATLLADNDTSIKNRTLRIKHIKRDIFTNPNKLGKQNSFELMKMLFTDLRRGTGATIISSAGAGEYALEGGDIQNGIFTYVVIEALKNKKADKNKDGEITVTELRDYVFDKVETYTGGAQHPSARRENLAVDFRIW